jgi:mRNA interferase HigB
MRVISKNRLLLFAQKHNDALKPLMSWYALANSASWKNFAELKKTIATADQVSNFTVFNIKGNHYRLIVDIQYQRRTIFIKYVLTHSEYDKNEWKCDPYY